MFAFPISAFTDMARSNVAMQTSVFLALSKSMLDTTSALGRLNIEAGKKLLEESGATFNEAMHSGTFDEARSFLSEQSRVAQENAQGYQQNLQAIVSEHARTVSHALGEHASHRSFSKGDDTGKGAGHASPRHEHETDHRPSRLVEKLVASIASDTDVLDD